MSGKLLEVGDVFHILPGMHISVGIPERYIYQGSKSWNLKPTTIAVGEVLTKGEPHLATASLVGDYVVEDARLTGGGCGHGPHDVYPDGWRIQARQLKDNRYDPNGILVEFYQSAHIGPYLPASEVPAVRRMKRIFIDEG